MLENFGANFRTFQSRKGEFTKLLGGRDHLRWLPRVSTKMTIRTGKTCKRSPSSVVLQSLFLNFTSKVTNIITLIFQVLLLRQAVFVATKHLKNDRYFPLIRLFS